MEKTLSITLGEFKHKLTTDIQESGLPIVIVDLVLKDLCNEIHNVAAEFTLKEIQEYQNSTSV